MLIKKEKIYFKNLCTFFVDYIVWIYSYLIDVTANTTVAVQINYTFRDWPMVFFNNSLTKP